MKFGMLVVVAMLSLNVFAVEKNDVKVDPKKSTEVGTEKHDTSVQGAESDSRREAGSKPVSKGSKNPCDVR